MFVDLPPKNFEYSVSINSTSNNRSDLILLFSLFLPTTVQVSINSTSNNRSDPHPEDFYRKGAEEFPLIPLPIIEAIIDIAKGAIRYGAKFPLIPLPIIEAMINFNRSFGSGYYSGFH